MSGTSVVGATYLQPIGMDWRVQAVADFSGDGKADILWRHSTTGRLIVWLMNGTARTFYASPGTVAESSWQIQ
jgi:hypothetical protein